MARGVWGSFPWGVTTVAHKLSTLCEPDWSEKKIASLGEFIHHSILSPQSATQVLQKVQVVMTTMGPSSKIWRMICKVEFLGLIWSWCIFACMRQK